MKLYSLLSIAVLFFFASCSSSRMASGTAAITEIRFISQYKLPSGLTFEGTVVGGLSSIDYDSQKGLYYMICDDPGARSPSRFYTAKINLSPTGIDSVILEKVTTIMNPAGKPYTDIREDRAHSLDAESMRYNPVKNEFIIGTEGQRVNEGKKWLIEQPAVLVQHYDGTYKDSFALPANMIFHETQNGPRHNSVFEGMTFADGYRSVYINTESPIYEDGYAAGTGDSSAWIRINKFDVDSRKLLAQYAYRLDPVPYPAIPAGAFKINGVTDILAFGKNDLLVLERGYSSGRGPSDVRVYLAAMRNASDISAVNSLEQSPPRKYFTKKLLFNFESLGRYIDNVEGVTFGPILPNGHRSLIFVVDNDFLATREMQFFLFEIIP